MHGIISPQRVCVCVLQESMIGEAQSLGERRRKAGGVKEMLQDATKLTHKLRFLVEEVRDSLCVCLCMFLCLWTEASCFQVVRPSHSVYAVSQEHLEGILFKFATTNSPKVKVTVTY